MILMWLNLAFMPVCAFIAGVIVWLLHRDEPLGDGALVRNFAFVLVLIAGAVAGTLRTDAVRLRIDPVFRIHTQIQSDRLYSTVAGISADDAEKLRNALQKQMAAGASLSDAYVNVWPWLWTEVRERTGWTDQATKLEWARFITDRLEAARGDGNFGLCFALMTHQSIDRATLLERFSPDDRQRFYDLAIRIYESSDKGMRHQYEKSEKHVEFNAVAREFSVIDDVLEQRFGAQITEQLRSDKLASTPPESYGRVCSARIFQLEEMQKRPKEMASRLTDSVLR